MQEISHYWFKWGNSFLEWTLDSELAGTNKCLWIHYEIMIFKSSYYLHHGHFEKSREIQFYAVICFHFWAKGNFVYSIWKLDGVPWFFLGTHKHELVLFIGDHSSLKPTMNKTCSFSIVVGIQKPCGPIFWTFLTPPPPSWTVLLNRLY